MYRKEVIPPADVRWVYLRGDDVLDHLSLLYPGSICPDLTGGYLRTIPLAKLVRDDFIEVNIYTTDENKKYHGQIDGINIIQDKKFNGSLDKFVYYFNGLFSNNFNLKVPECALDNIDDTLFQLEGPYFYNFIKKTNIDRFILDEHNIYWELQEFPSSDPKELVYNTISGARNKKIELEALNAADHVLVCSKRDKQLILAHLPHIVDKITVIPNCVFASEYSQYIMDASVKNRDNEPCSVLFVGSLSYAPNIDAVRIICSRIAPVFGDEVQFLIVGKNPPDIPRPSNVNFVGYVDDVKEYIMKSDICIAPLRYGSGTRLKILEYMAMGKPIVSTSKGAEGIDYTENKDIIIEDDLDAFSEKIRILLDDRRLRINLGKNAMDLIQQKYDWEIYRKTLHEVYEACR
ncbi:glycosyltransferase [Methanofollis aquaemaris]|uniref:Glycosyltransferase n=1 Tax=Methanofollis aquaemaris TaxID=126734 RepID=A0A8A3S6X7_9EURY|nr:glycosyltransferase family 4 protein [Methanofollis aquaemaris]QSZ67888.1 glycosyltransferase [Methanofollis aquaemaris]